MLNYTKFGTGPLTMIAFHGFGRDATMFKSYESVFASYTIYSVDLYFHGTSENYQPHYLDEHHWKLVFSDFLRREQIDKFSLLGFSLGGKLALFTYQLFSERIENLHLIAPYGIQKNLVEVLVQRTPFLYKKLNKFVDDPSYLFRMLNVLHFCQLINTTLVKIIAKQLDSKHKRFRAFHTMLIYGAVKLDLENIQQSISLHGSRVHLYIGKYDQVLRLKTLYQYLGYLKHFSLHVLPSGHGSLPDKVKSLLAQKSENTNLIKEEAMPVVTMNHHKLQAY
ncbi:MAG: alpha/beta hydrolase [Tunicatimonas sp.]|uniref:alpha/beta hydrolase n=1 Tax=Tunicatimonas sp. TaxID=1940096 RepID=UPI003C78151E